jgi:PAS domain S-box-containing protein
MQDAGVAPTPETILDHISDALALLDLGGQIIYANDRLAELFGCSAESLRGRRWRELLDADAAARLDPVNWGALDCPEAHFNIEMPAVDGSQRTYCLTASPVRDDRGRTIGVLENFRGMDKLRDMILELRDVADAIRREKDKTEQVIDSIADGIFTIDRHLVVRSMSPRLEGLLGIEASEAVGRPCSQVLRGSKCSTDCPMRWTLDRGAVVERCREVLRRRDGSGLPVSLTTAFLHDARGELEGLIGVVRDQSEIERLRREVNERFTSHDLVGRSAAMRQLIAAIDAVADTDATALITGETGTGKELVARGIHNGSARRDKPFLSLNCAALNDNLLESELFGHVRGAYTGAVSDKVGRFEAAAGGTIFLDEIGDTTPAFQAKLLRVLQEKTFERVGDTRTRRTDARVIAATNRDLLRLVHDARFREDLYYRLAVVPIAVPPLRSRTEDIPLLVEHFMVKYRHRHFAGREDEFEGISNRALALMLQYSWPGNIRELEHAVEYAMVSTTTNRIERAFLPAPLRQLQPAEDVSPAADRTEPVAAPAGPGDELRRALEANRWNASRAARALGISRTTLWRRMRQYGLMASR